jgi:Tripartite tricarboxylate transporter family receptor
MSVSGQKPTFRVVCSMSALPPKADMDQHGRDVRFVPKADIVVGIGYDWCSGSGGITMKLPRRKFLHLAASAAALPAMPSIASALDYPTRPVRLIAPFPPGGVVDLFSRLIAQPLSERLGQPVFVENRAGAGGNLGTEAVVRAAPRVLPSAQQLRQLSDIRRDPAAHIPYRAWLLQRAGWGSFLSVCAEPNTAAGSEKVSARA